MKVDTKINIAVCLFVIVIISFAYWSAGIQKKVDNDNIDKRSTVIIEQYLKDNSLCKCKN